MMFLVKRKTTKPSSTSKDAKPTSSKDVKLKSIAPWEQAAAAKQAHLDLTDICDLVAEIKKEFGVPDFEELKTLLKEVLEKIKSCTSVQEKLFAFMGAKCW